MTGVAALPQVRGKLTARAPLAPLVWFKSGGVAELLFEPADVDDLQTFVRQLDPSTPLWPLGLGSNLIVRDGGVPGVTVRLGKPFARVEQRDPVTLWCGGAASGILVSSTARDAGISGLEFLRGIPGTVGGFVKMNGGAYGREVRDILVDAEVIMRSGERVFFRWKSLAIPIVIPSCRSPASSWARPSGVFRVSLRPSGPKWIASLRSGNPRSRCGRRPVVRRSRTLLATRPGNWSMKRGAGD